MESNHELHLKKLGIDTYKEAVIYIRSDSSICISEGFSVPTRIRVSIEDRTILATLNTIDGDLLAHDEVSLSHYAWNLLDSPLLCLF